jgi:membrane associated rhomboid family serine protease
MVFPIGDDNRDRHLFPLVNIVLIVINVFVFVVLQGMGSNEAFTMAFSTVPREIVTGRDVVTENRLQTFDTAEGKVQLEVPGLRPTPVSVYLTLLTSMFMHGSLMHLGGNMWFLWIFGDNIENDLGRVRYIIFYLLCGLLASLAHVLTNASGAASLIPCLGASGAISGVMGGYLVLHPRRQVTVLLFRFITQVPGFVAVGLWFVFQVVSSLQVLGGSGDGVAYGAHIGGFIAGAALVKIFTIGLPHNKPLTETYDDETYGRPRRTPWG